MIMAPAIAESIPKVIAHANMDINSDRAIGKDIKLCIIH
jgi:hypothetical protein